MAGMGRIFLRVIGGVLVLLLVIVAADVLLWEYKASRGNGYESMQVSKVSIASLKGSKEEYYSDGSVTVRCTRSMLPMPAADGWFAPCWWQRKHRTLEIRY
jgi:hypothetical protein